MENVTQPEQAGKDKGQHPHHDKTVRIIVNGREKDVPKNDDLTFNELVGLAFNPVPTGEFICFTITYRKGHGNKPEGTLAEGESVKAKEGMIFNVTATDKS